MTEEILSGKHDLTSYVHLKSKTEATDTCMCLLLIKKTKKRTDKSRKERAESNHGPVVQHVQVSAPLLPPTHVPQIPPKMMLPKPNTPNPYANETSELLNLICLLLRSNRPSLEDPELSFDITPEAALSNLSALHQHKYNL